MDTPLVDREGFPRSDIDVAGVRTARVQIIRLRNDLKGVMGQLEEVVKRGLPKGEEGAEEERVEDVEMEENGGEKGEGGEQAWAKIDAVAPGSPADSAVRPFLFLLLSLTANSRTGQGLKRDDLFISLSSITAADHDSLRAVAALVGRSEGIELEVVVRRGTELKELRLTPNKWGGRGLLGCVALLPSRLNSLRYYRGAQAVETDLSCLLSGVTSSLSPQHDLPPHFPPPGTYAFPSPLPLPISISLPGDRHHHTPAMKTTFHLKSLSALLARRNRSLPLPLPSAYLTLVRVPHHRNRSSWREEGRKRREGS